MKFFYFFKNYYNWARVFNSMHLSLGATVLLGLAAGLKYDELRNVNTFLLAAIALPIVTTTLFLFLQAGYVFMVNYSEGMWWNKRGFIPIVMYPGYVGLVWTGEELLEQHEYFKDFPKDKEIIVASAVRTPDGTVYASPCPGRHFHCIGFANQMNPDVEFGKLDTTDQGFMTNTNRYIDRIEARRIAIANMWIVKFTHETKAFSEDLWETPEHLKWKDPNVKAKT